jgi:hypothetical protein
VGCRAWLSSARPRSGTVRAVTGHRQRRSCHYRRAPRRGTADTPRTTPAFFSHAQIKMQRAALRLASVAARPAASPRIAARAFAAGERRCDTRTLRSCRRARGVVPLSSFHDACGSPTPHGSVLACHTRWIRRCLHFARAQPHPLPPPPAPRAQLPARRPSRSRSSSPPATASPWTRPWATRCWRWRTPTTSTLRVRARALA